MVTSLKAGSTVEASPELEAIISDIASLKHDIATLAGHLRSGGVNAASDAARGAAGQLSDAARGAAGQLSDEALRVYENLAAQGQRSAKAIGRQVEEQPVMSLLLAFALGLLGGRLLSR